MYAQDHPVGSRKVRRIAAIDLARGAALVAMAVYHFAWDLEFFGYVEPGTTAAGGWKLFARAIATSFLILAGVSLALAHGKGIRWKPFFRRLAKVGGAAALISAGTFVAIPNDFIFFGILHQIALASVLGLAFLRLPAPVTLLAAAATIAAPHFLRSPLFDHPALWWVGLSTQNPHSNDYVPVFPWFGAVLAGIGAARLFVVPLGRLAGREPPAAFAPLSFAGRHSLAFYLLHQPLLIGALWLFSQLAPPAVPPQDAQFLRACQASCLEARTGPFCTTYCGCMLDRLVAAKALDSIFTDAQNTAVQESVQAMAAACTEETDAELRQEGGGSP